MFPLPLTPFEKYYWCDDRPEYPTAFAFDLTFQGTLDDDRLEHALRAVLPRHPLLQSRVELDHAGRPAWVHLPDAQPEIRWAEDSAEPGDVAARLDLSSGIGLAVWAQRRDGCPRLHVAFHHACCDALGAIGFVEDWFVAYDALIRGNSLEAALRSLSPQQLLSRGNYQDRSRDGSGRSMLAGAWHALHLWTDLLAREPMVLQPRSERPAPVEPARPRPPVISHTLDAEHTRALRRIASSRQARLNDLLLRDLLLALERWTVDHGRHQRRFWRITIPAALRDRLDREMPATNVLGYSFLARHPRELRDADRLLQQIGEETAERKHRRRGVSFLRGLQFIARFPAFLRWRLRQQRSFASAVFSNLGRIGARSRLRGEDGRLYSGDLVLTHIVGAPPVRPGTRASFATYQYGRQTVLTLRIDPHWFTQQDAEHLLQAFAQRLEHTVRTES